MICTEDNSIVCASPSCKIERTSTDEFVDIKSENVILIQTSFLASTVLRKRAEKIIVVVPLQPVIRLVAAFIFLWTNNFVGRDVVAKLFAGTAGTKVTRLHIEKKENILCVKMPSKRNDHIDLPVKYFWASLSLHWDRLNCNIRYASKIDIHFSRF